MRTGRRRRFHDRDLFRTSCSVAENNRLAFSENNLSVSLFHHANGPMFPSPCLVCGCHSSAADIAAHAFASRSNLLLVAYRSIASTTQL